MKHDERSKQKGFATLEAAALMMVFMVLFGYMVGTFGVVHSAILNSIAARAYAWETFNHRANLNYFRDNRPGTQLLDYREAGFGYRFHGIAGEGAPGGDDNWTGTVRALTIASNDAEMDAPGANSCSLIGGSVDVPVRAKANPVCIKTVYGICLNSTCQGRTP